jgi:secreted trypsin-like serine protease
VTTRTWLAAAAISAVMAGLLSAAAPASAIVGGTDAAGVYRAMVDVQREHADGSFSLTCGGSVISHQGRIGVLTGAHCVTDDTGAALPTEQIRLAVGSTLRDAGRIVEVTGIAVPDGWDWGAPGPDGQFDQVDDWAVLLPASTLALHPTRSPGWPRPAGCG